MQEKIRIYALAREMNIESKDLVDICRQAGIDVKNQLSSLDPDQRDLVVQLATKGGGTATASPPKSAAPKLPTIESRIRVLPQQAKPRTPATNQQAAAPSEVAEPQEEQAAQPSQSSDLTPAAITTPPEKPVDLAPEIIPQPEAVAPPSVPQTAPAAIPQPIASNPDTPQAQPVKPPESTQPPAAPSSPVPPPTTTRAPNLSSQGGRIPVLGGNRPPTLRPIARPQPRPGGQVTPPAAASAGSSPPGSSSGGTTGPGSSGSGGTARPQQSGISGARPPASTGPGPAPRPGGMTSGGPRQGSSGVVRRPGPFTPRQPPAKDDKKPETGIMKPKVSFGGHVPAPGAKAEDVIKKFSGEESPVVPAPDDDEEGGDNKNKVRPGKVSGRESRHQQREQRAKSRKQNDVVAKVVHGEVIIEDERPVARRSGKRGMKKHHQAATMPRKGKVPVTVPITIRALSEALGVKSMDLLFRLTSQGVAGLTINSNLDPDLSATIALDFGIELDIKRPATAEEQVLEQFERKDEPGELLPRAPIVTIMGHVDHGKTTLLDKIRQSNVAATEAGGITQVIRAWRVDHNGKPVTFLDTPGHEAFTKMRARGAQVTDIAVIVVAADDGVMPQTTEAINHAKAAGVSIVVAINKVDVPNANINKTRQQLYGMNLLPDNMGGDVPFVECSAAKGTGIDLLLDNLSIVAELKELKANPNKPASGTCLEAMLSGGEGVRATALVREGTLRRGDVILCGATYGRVRAMYDDLGRPIQEAGPSVPVRITGLDEVPNADDPFLVVPDLAIAGEIASVRKARQQESAMAMARKPLTLDRLMEAKIAELKVIIKADFRGSIEAIKKELEKLEHDEVIARVLHAGIGGITESDVQLALTSPDDTLIVGFNVVPDDQAKRLAEERGIEIREYNIIYNLTNDIKAALEGKLKPQEVIKNLGRAVVRNTFKISRVGTIAGCFVTEGQIERSAKVRLIRNGVVIYPPPDRTVGLDSLKRFKDDVREVARGFECGIKIAGYDDVKVDDVIEAYRVDQVQRTLTTKS